MRLYVGNLNYATKEDDLRRLFGAYGEVKSVAVITDRETGRSKGFGFVEFNDAAAGEAAINDLNGKEVGGRALKINEARPRADWQDRPRSGGGDRDRDRGGWR